MEQLDFEGESSVSDNMFRGFVELKVNQIVGNSLVAEGSSVQGREQDVVSGVEQNNWSGVVLDVGWVVEIKGSGSWTGFRESDGRLSVSGALSIERRGLGSRSFVDLAVGETEGFPVTFFSSVSNVVTAAVSLAVGSAGVRCSVVILSSIITLLSMLNNSISTNRSGSGIIGWNSHKGGGGNDWVSTVETLEVSVGGWWDDVGKSTALGGCQQSWLLHNEPSDILGAWWSGFRTNIAEGSQSGRRNQEVQVDVPSRQSLTASVEGAHRGASRKSSVGVIGTSITLLTKISLSHTVTTECAGTSWGTSG